MIDYNYLDKIGSIKLYQCIIVLFLFVINLGTYIPSYYISFIVVKPYVFNSTDNSTSTILTYEMCVRDNNFRVDKSKLRLNFQLDKDFSLFSNDYFYCDKFSMALLLSSSAILNYLFQMFFLLIRSRYSFFIIILLSNTILGICIILFKSLVNTISFLLFASVVNSFIRTYSINYITNLTTLKYRIIFINLLTLFPSNTVFFIFTYLFKNSINKEDVTTPLLILYSGCIIISVILFLISVDYPKIFGNNRAQIINSLTKITKINNFYNKKLAVNIVRNLENLFINEIRFRNDERHRVGNVIMGYFMLNNAIHGFLYNTSLSKLNKYAYSIEITWYYMISANLILSMLISFFRNYSSYFLKNFMAIVFILFNFAHILNEEKDIMFLIWKLTFDNLLGINFSQNHCYFSDLNDHKFIVVNCILFLCFWQGAIIAPFVEYYNQTLNVYFNVICGFMILIINYIIKDKKYAENYSQF